jgi:hypothetical protein
VEAVQVGEDPVLVFENADHQAAPASTPTGGTESGLAFEAEIALAGRRLTRFRAGVVTRFGSISRTG